MNDYSILINSCDSYSDIWPYFFYILSKTWKSEMPSVFLNTESCDFQVDDFKIQVLNVLPKKDKSIMWGERLIDCLSRIDTEYVLMMLEDFLFEEPIQTKIIEKCVDSMKNNPQIAAYQFIHPSEGYSNKVSFDIVEGFAERKKYGNFKIVAGPSLWRKKDLMMLTLRSDSPWEWEYFGSYRTYMLGKTFCCIKDKHVNVFVYDIDHGGAIHRGKWVGYKIEELQKKYNFQVNYGSREVEYDWMRMSQYTETPHTYKRLGSIITNRFKIAVNVFLGLYLRFQKGKQKKKGADT